MLDLLGWRQLDRKRHEQLLRLGPAGGLPTHHPFEQNALVRDVQALADAIKAQAGEVADLRKKLDGVKKLLD